MSNPNNQIGDFLSALRKSNGFTQQQVADRLGVSNKTVSSWEAGISSPDISILPAIAELYGVSCDEIIRGKRIGVAAEEKYAYIKKEKATAHFLRRQKRNLSTFCLISYGLTAVGVILTLLLGFAALESRIGFFIGLIFLAASFITPAVGFRNIRFAVGDEWNSNETDELYDALNKSLYKIICINAAAFGFIAPHVIAPGHTGLSFTFEWLATELLCGLIALLIALAVCVPLYVHKRKKALKFLEEQDETDSSENVPEELKKTRKSKLRKIYEFQWKAKHAALIILLPFLFFAACAGATAIAASTYGRDSVIYTEIQINLEDLTAFPNTQNGPFAECDYTLESEETPPTENATGRFAAKFLFKNFPEQWKNYYRTENTDSGTLVTVYKYRFALADVEEIIEFYALDPNWQGGVQSIRRRYDYIISTEKPNAEQPTIISLSLYPSLTEQRSETTADALWWTALGFTICTPLSFAATIPSYLHKLKKHKNELREAHEE